MLADLRTGKAVHALSRLQRRPRGAGLGGGKTPRSRARGADAECLSPVRRLRSRLLERDAHRKGHRDLSHRGREDLEGASVRKERRGGSSRGIRPFGWVGRKVSLLLSQVVQASVERETAPPGWAVPKVRLRAQPSSRTMPRHERRSRAGRIRTAVSAQAARFTDHTPPASCRHGRADPGKDAPRSPEAHTRS